MVGDLRVGRTQTGISLTLETKPTFPIAMAAMNTGPSNLGYTFICGTWTSQQPCEVGKTEMTEFLNEKAEHVPRGHSWTPHPAGETVRNGGKERQIRARKDPLSPNMGKLLFCHFPHIFIVIILTRILCLDDKYGLLLITFTAHTSSVSGDKESNNHLHE